MARAGARPRQEHGKGPPSIATSAPDWTTRASHARTTAAAREAWPHWSAAPTLAGSTKMSQPLSSQ
eukprot:12824581-Alexandrium_andersonii.AAC.1